MPRCLGKRPNLKMKHFMSGKYVSIFAMAHLKKNKGLLSPLFYLLMKIRGSEIWASLYS